MPPAAAEAVEAPKKAEKKPRRKLPKKLLVTLLAAGLLVAGCAAVTVVVLKKRAATLAALQGEDGVPPEQAQAQAEARAEPEASGEPPSFLPLEPFVVNLADREQERYAQIGITLQVDGSEAAERLKAYMPAIRNGVLMILAHKSSAELLERAGKERLAAEIMRESVRPLGIELPAQGSARPAANSPVVKVHFSSFIIQ